MLCTAFWIFASACAYPLRSECGKILITRGFERCFGVFSSWKTYFPVWSPPANFVGFSLYLISGLSNSFLM